MMIGTVRRWFDEQGYGFIQPEGGGKDIFVHHSGVESEGSKKVRLEEGDSVEFTVISGRKGPQASEVIVLRRK